MMEVNECSGYEKEIQIESDYLKMMKGKPIVNSDFKCPNANLNDYEEGVICDIGYACDACPYNPELKEYKGVKSKW